MAQMRVPQRFAPPNPYYYAQQPWDGRMGTRSIGGQEQPLSPTEFGIPGQPAGFRGPPGGVQGQAGGVQGQVGGFQGQQGQLGSIQGQPGGFQGQQGQLGGFQGQLGGVQGQFGGAQGQLGQQQGVGMPEQAQVSLTQQEKMALQAALEILKEGRAALASGVVEGPVIQRLTAAHAYVAGFLEAKGIEELGEYLATIPQVTTRGTPIEDPEYDQLLDEFEGFLGDESQTMTRGGWGKLGKMAWKIAKKHGPRVAGEVAEYGERRGWW
jgi:hypothetical protein